MPITQLIAGLGTILAAIVAAAKILWDQSRADITALRAQLEAAQSARDSHHRAELDRHTALVEALTKSTDALRESRELAERLHQFFEAREVIEDPPKRTTNPRGKTT